VSFGRHVFAAEMKENHEERKRQLLHSRTLERERANNNKVELLKVQQQQHGAISTSTENKK
jgi:hypothetical protein